MSKRNHLGVPVLNPYNMLGKAIEIAVVAHAGVLDRQGKPYILHPLRIMNGLMYDPELAVMGILHDVMEDTNVTEDDLYRAGMSDRVMTALKLLTHKEEDSYGVYIDGICTNYDAIRVKRKDIEDNSNVTRLKGVTDKNMATLIKYARSFKRLGEAKKQFKVYTVKGLNL